MIYIGADHAGYKLKEKIKKYFDKNEIEYVDVGAERLKSDDDYPDYAAVVAEHVAGKKEAQGILICGTGAGMAIAANKFKGIRAALAWSAHTARKAVEDDHANIITLPARVISDKESLAAVAAFLAAKPSRLSRHIRRINKVKALEKK